MLNLMELMEQPWVQTTYDANFDAYCFDAVVSFTPST